MTSASPSRSSSSSSLDLAEKCHYVLVTGGRDFDDRESMFETLSFLKLFYDSSLRLIHGGAKGADRLAGEVCKELDIPFRVYPAEWGKHGKKAGPIRNAQMVANLAKWRDLGHTVQVLSFPGGNGTRHCSNEAEKAGIDVDYVRRECSSGPE